MNFLAHLYLSGDNPKIKVGNFIGDFVRGRNLEERYGPDIARGIELHRAIDEFTDSHAVVQRSKNRLRPKYRHYSGVIVDIFYDHFLARKWSDFNNELLPDYADQTYTLLLQHQSVLPNEVNWMLPHMIKGNWLANYARIDGIHRALSGMARRTPYPSRMDEASGDLQEFYPDFEKEFDEFFPLAEKFSGGWLRGIHV